MTEHKSTFFPSPPGLLGESLPVFVERLKSHDKLYENAKVFVAGRAFIFPLRGSEAELISLAVIRSTNKPRPTLVHAFAIFQVSCHTGRRKRNFSTFNYGVVFASCMSTALAHIMLIPRLPRWLPSLTQHKVNSSVEYKSRAITVWKFK